MDNSSVEQFEDRLTELANKSQLETEQQPEQDYLSETDKLQDEIELEKGFWGERKQAGQYIIPDVGRWEMINRTGNPSIDWAFTPAGQYDAGKWIDQYLGRDATAGFQTPAMPTAVTNRADYLSRNVIQPGEYYQNVSAKKAVEDWDDADKYAYAAYMGKNTDVFPVGSGASNMQGGSDFRKWLMTGDIDWPTNKAGEAKRNVVLFDNIAKLDKDGNVNYTWDRIMKDNPEFAYNVNSHARLGYDVTIGIDSMGAPFMNLSGYPGSEKTEYENNLSKLSNTLFEKLFDDKFFGNQLHTFDAGKKDDMQRLAEIQAQLTQFANNNTLGKDLQEKINQLQATLSGVASGQLKLDRNDIYELLGGRDSKGEKITGLIWKEYYAIQEARQEALAKDQNVKAMFQGTYFLDPVTGYWTNNSGYKPVMDKDGKVTYVRGVTNIDLLANDKNTITYKQVVENRSIFGFPYTNNQLETIYGKDILKTKEILISRQSLLPELAREMKNDINNWTAIKYTGGTVPLMPVQVPGMNVDQLFEKFRIVLTPEQKKNLPSTYFQHNMPLTVWLNDNRVIKARNEAEFSELVTYLADKGAEYKAASGIKLMSLDQFYADEMQAHKITMMPAVPAGWKVVNDDNGRFVALELGNGWTRTIDGYKDDKGNSYTIDAVKKSPEMLKQLADTFLDNDIAELKEWANSDPKAFLDLVKDTHHLPETKVLFDRMFSDMPYDDRQVLRLFSGLDKDDKVKYVNDLIKLGDTPLTRELINEILPENKERSSMLVALPISNMIPVVGPWIGLYSTYKEFTNRNAGKVAFAPDLAKQVLGGIGDIFSEVGNTAQWLGAEGLGAKILNDTSIGRNLTMPPDLTAWESMHAADKIATCALLAARQLPLLAVTMAISAASMGIGGVVIGGASKLMGATRYAKLFSMIAGITSDYLTRGNIDGLMEGGQTYEQYLALHPGDINGARKAAGATYWDNMALQGANIPEFMLNVGLSRILPGGSKLYNTVRKGTAVFVSSITEAGTEWAQNWVQSKNLEQPFDALSPENQVTLVTSLFMGGALSAGTQWANGHFNNIVKNTVDQLPETVQGAYQTNYDTAIAMGLTEEQASTWAINEMVDIPIVKEILTDNAIKENDVIVNEQVEASKKRAEAIKQTESPAETQTTPENRTTETDITNISNQLPSVISGDIPFETWEEMIRKVYTPEKADAIREDITKKLTSLYDQVVVREGNAKEEERALQAAGIDTTGRFDKPVSKLITREQFTDVSEKINIFFRALNKVEAEKATEQITASVPFIITKQMESDLKGKGYSQENIDKMTPQEAQDILSPKQETPTPTTETPVTATEQPNTVQNNVQENVQPITNQQLPNSSDKMPIQSKGEEVESQSVYLNNVKQRLEEYADIDITYNPMSIENDSKKASDFVINNIDEARGVVIGYKTPPAGVTDTAVRLAYTEKMIMDENWEEAAKAANSVKLTGIRKGQEVVAYRGAVNDNSPQYFINQVIQSRMNLVDENINPKKQRTVSTAKVTERIKSEVKTITSTINKKQIDINEAQKIIDGIATDDITKKLIVSAFKNKDITIQQLYDSTSFERNAIFNKYVTPELAQKINAAFEKAMISQQKSAIQNWFKNTFNTNESNASYKNIVDKINDLDKLGLLDTTNTEGFLSDLVAEKLGFTVTTEEVKNITAKAKILESLSGNIDEFGLPTLEYWKARRDIDKYVQSLTPTNQLKIATSIIGRGNLLFSVKSPLTNIISNTAMQAYTALDRRMSNKKYKGLNNDYALRYAKRVNEIYQKSGYDVSRLDAEWSNQRRLGETITHSEGTGFIRKYGRWMEDIVYKWLMGAPDVAFSSVSFADSANLASTKIAQHEGLKGDVAKQRALEIFKDATTIEPKTVEGQFVRGQAIADARFATYTNNGAYSDLAMAIRNALNKASKDVRLGDQLMPFVKTPANVVQAGVEAAGLGVFEGFYKLPAARQALKIGNHEPMRQVVQHFVRSGLGMVLATVLCYMFDPEDFVGEYDSITQKERDIAKMKNATYNSIKIGDKYISLDYFGPLASPLVGLMYARKYGDNLPEKIYQYGRGVVGQALRLPGLREFSEIYEDTVKAVKSGTFGDITKGLTETAISFIRSRSIVAIVNDIAQATDTAQRETSGDAIDKTKASIPGLRQQLPESINQLTGETNATEGLISTILFGSRVKTASNNNIVKEIDRLYGNNAGPTISNISYASTRMQALQKQIGNTKFQEALKYYSKQYSARVSILIDPKAMAPDSKLRRDQKAYPEATDEGKKKLIDKMRDQSLEDTLKVYGYIKATK